MIFHLQELQCNEHGSSLNNKPKTLCRNVVHIPATILNKQSGLYHLQIYFVQNSPFALYDKEGWVLLFVLFLAYLG